MSEDKISVMEIGPSPVEQAVLLIMQQEAIYRFAAAYGVPRAMDEKPNTLAVLR